MKHGAKELQQEAREFGVTLKDLKGSLQAAFPWYPHETLNNFAHIRPLLEASPLTDLAQGFRVADVGAADGDTAFFLEKLGYEADIIDYGPTNYNGLRGARLLREHLGSRVNIYEFDLDSQFSLPQEHYGVIFFLGILYHLKNPYYALETLARRTDHLLVSTRVARYAPNGKEMFGLPVAYLLGPQESNNDATNYWIFTEAGLARIFERTGWHVLASHTNGDTKTSNPANPDQDERFFGLLRSRYAKAGR